MNIKTLSCYLIFLMSIASYGEENAMKWGRIPNEDLYPMKDSTNASAIVLGDYGIIKFAFSHDGSYKMFFDRHVRIKIINAAGYDWANVQIPYNSADNIDRIENIDAQCFFLDAEGKPERHDLERKSIIDEVVYKNYHNIRFSIPSVKAGSVIEYRYRIISDDFNIKPWNFQWTIPVRISQLTTRIPEYFYYSPVFLGSSVTISKADDEYFENELNGVSTSKIIGRETIFCGKNIPAFIVEPYITSTSDHLRRVIFQLRNINIPGQIQRNRIITWEDLTNKIMEDENFGRQLKKNSFLREVTANVIGASKDSDEMILKIFSYVQNSILFNGRYTIWTDDNLKHVYDDKVGTGSDLNFIFLLMARFAGFHADPVLISTRNHGRIQIALPIFEQFNHVIVNVSRADGIKLYDLIDKDNGCNLLPSDDINGTGLLLKEKGLAWIPVNAPKISRKYTHSAASIDAGGKLLAKTDISYDGYFASGIRYSIKKQGKNEYIKNNFEAIIPDLILSSSDILQLDSAEQPLKVNLDYETAHYSNVANDICYFKPLQFTAIENPFKPVTRDFPVNFNYPREEIYILNITIPDGYTVNEIPPAVRYTLPDNSVQFTYNLTSAGNSIQVMTKLLILKVEYVPEEYSALREIFNQIASKNEEQLVLKKK